MRRRGSLLGSIILVLWLLGAASAHATFPGHNGKITFDGISTIYPDGRDLTRVTTDGTDSTPSWSPDGTKLVVTRFMGEETPNAIFTMNPDGSGQTLLRTSASTPAWSNDGTKVVFHTESVPNGLAVINANGTGSTVILQDTVGFYNSYPAWSPDGQEIAFHRCSTSTSMCDIYKMNPNGSGVTNLTNGNGIYNARRRPSWSPDSSKIFFGRFPGNPSPGIWSMNRNGSGLTQIRATGTSLGGLSPCGACAEFPADDQLNAMSGEGRIA